MWNRRLAPLPLTSSFCPTPPCLWLLTAPTAEASLLSRHLLCVTAPSLLLWVQSGAEISWRRTFKTKDYQGQSEKAQKWRRPLILQRSICWPASYSRWLSDKESAFKAGDAGDMGSLPGSGRSSGVGNGNLLLYSWLENSMDRGAWWATVHGVAKSRHDWATEHTHAPAIVQGGE